MTYSTRPRRIPIRIPITHSNIEIFLDSEIMNLSRGGVFLRADLPLPLGSELEFEFVLPGTNQVVHALGTVVWARKRGVRSPHTFPNHPPGMGIQFKKIDPEDVETILDIIDALS